VFIQEDEFSISKLRITEAQFNNGMEMLNTLDGNGMNATDVVTESWMINNRQYDSENNRWTGTVATRNTKGELIDTGIQISSTNVTDNEGTNAPSGVWTSSSYRSEAAETEKQ